MVSARSVFIVIALLMGAASAGAQGNCRAHHRHAVSPRHRYGRDPDSIGGDVVRSASQPTVKGNRAIVRSGVAYAPSNAPQAVKRAIWAANGLRSKPYKWGGGHGSFSDSGYDCSGTVSFALHYAGLLAAPVQSSELRNYGERGCGRWITIYSRSGHTFAVIAGLRLDTTGFCGTEGPRWHADGRATWGFEARHPVGL
jgi:hypothetical protein